MEKGRLNREIWGVVISLTALLIIISLVSYNPNDRSLNTPSGLIAHNWGGFVGAFLADLLLQGLGLAAYLLPIFLALAAYHLFLPSFKGLRAATAVSYTVLLIGIAVLLSLLIASENARDAGGIVGGFLTESVLVPLFGRISATLILLAALLLATMTVSQISLADLLDRSGKRLLQFRKFIVPKITRRAGELKQQKDKPKGENTKSERRDYVPPPIVVKADPKEELIKKVVKKPTAPHEQFKLPVVGEGYRLPPLELLDPPDPNQLIKVDTSSLHASPPRSGHHDV